MKACLGQNVKISLPKAYQMKERSKTLVVKGVRTEFTDDKLKEILDSKKVQYAKAERIKSRTDGRSNCKDINVKISLPKNVKT